MGFPCSLITNHFKGCGNEHNALCNLPGLSCPLIGDADCIEENQQGAFIHKEFHKIQSITQDGVRWFATGNAGFTIHVRAKIYTHICVRLRYLQHAHAFKYAYIQSIATHSLHKLSRCVA